MNDFKDMIVWQKSMMLVKEIYKLVKFLPKEEQFALSDQMRRAVVSIPSNIAEGKARTGNKDYVHFLSIALGSEYELLTQLIICTELKYLSKDQIIPAYNLCNEVGKMLNSIIAKLGARC